MKTSKKEKLTVRWCLSGDLPRLVEIDGRSSGTPWSLEDFDACLRCTKANGVVVEVGDRVAGYMMYMMSRDRFVIVAMAVDPCDRRRGCGSRLLEYLKRRVRANHDRNRTLECVASDRQVDGHLFLKGAGFLATEVMSHHFGPDHDGYRFVWSESRR